MFGTVPPWTCQGKNTRSPARPFDLGLDLERAFVGILSNSEQAFPEHPFHRLACHTP